MRVLFAALSLLLMVSPALAQEQQLSVIGQQLAAQKDFAASQPAQAVHPEAVSCPATTVIPPRTIQGSLTTSSCTDILGLHEDVYALTVSAGQTLSVDYSSTAYDTFLYMYLGNGTSAPTNLISTRTGSGLSRQTMNYTFSVGGTYYVEAEALWITATPSFPNTGPYTISFALTGGSGSCQANAQTLCLNGNRFAVTVTWKDHSNPPKTGSGQATAVTSDSGYFWFFSSSNIELVVKLIDGRALGGHWWVFYGSLTDVEFTMTVRDMTTGQVKTYVNPSGKMASVGDTNAF